MKILTVDVGTGTQDIFLYDSQIDIENGFKLVLPSPTMMVRKRIQEATRSQVPILLTGLTMGGGPSSWAVNDHLKAGFPVYATENAARTLDDNLDAVAEMGIILVSDDEASNLPTSIQRIEFRDFDFPAITDVFARFGVSLDDLAAVAVAVFDHGAAPPDISDRQFRFDYLDERIRERNALSSFAFLAKDIPPIMTRLQAVADSARDVDAPLIVMDTAPAAVLGATFDPIVAQRKQKIIANIGNFHTLAFRLGDKGIEGVFEHHTGEIDLPKLEGYLQNLADGTLQHETIFNDMGHGALIYNKEAMLLNGEDFDVVVTGPRRSMYSSALTPTLSPRERESTPTLRPYFSVPFGDMMIAGCFGMLSATTDLLPNIAEDVRASLKGAGGAGTPPWEIG
ncbi:MAG: DUF1786 domain-containing protein [Anaerolineales bacterium]|uniref:DUF1786 domain-containing protein n=1 Tax=Candidatus Desulfolinea nitratireducens TaxID=2841698 RepID=A0A8J6TDK3_9CHLR|nr:DUF1786 domain-containing protein [Candidatus Desulfolinea nitratireducens]MBL6960911.1 DUF1786 domain-containing protein [Anaerolineales bacterium]